MKAILQQLGRDGRKWRRSAVVQNFLQVYSYYLVDHTHHCALKRKKALAEACVAGQTVKCNSNCKRRKKFVHQFNISGFTSLKAQLGVMCPSK